MDIQLNDPFFAEKSKAINALYRVIDPELFVNIIDLGLVYDLDFTELSRVNVIMTLSTPHCPLGDAISSGVKNSMKIDFPNLEIDVNIVWEPKWNYTMLTDEGRSQLGFNK